MEPGDRAAQALTWRFRLVAVSLGLTALAFVQAPGRVVTDTKLDLTVDPFGFLARALTLWDPVGAFGQVQNQAYGYLFPMGPFFALGRLAHVEPWVVQRLWWSLLLVTAFLGVVKLCAVLSIGLPWTRVLAALAYVLSPRVMSVIGPSSIEVWPMALAPWVLVPLVAGMRRHDPRRMASLSALAVVCVGGVNAVATFAVIPLGALWLLVQPASPRRRSLMLWWPALVLLGTLWWLVPLLLLGRYSPPFLDFIESASTTTFTANAFDALRGTSDWVPYIDANSRAGNALLRSSSLILNGTVVIALGLVGVARRDNRHRVFLLSGVLLGLVLVTLGHLGAVDGWGARWLQDALDGVLAPLRNTHKFDVVVRLPLVLGLAHLLGSVGSARDRGAYRPLALGVAVLAAAGVVGSTVPAWTAQLPNSGTFASIPQYWRDTARWLNRQDDERRALLLPASAFGDYLWGRTADEPLQPLARSPWAVRSSVPLAPGANIDMLDAIERRLSTGQGSAGFADFLRRAGIGYLVVRNDIRWPGDSIDPELVYATLRSTPGVRSVASFGPRVGGGASVRSVRGENVFINHGFHAAHPAVEVFSVPGGAAGIASSQAVADTPVVLGSPGSLLRLHDLDVLGDESTMLVDAVPRSMRPQRVILTDGNRRQETAFGRAHDNRSASLTPDAPYATDRRVHAYTTASTGQSVPHLVGARSITASSSQADASTPSPIVQAALPWAAFDADPQTTWRASADDIGASSWVEVRLERPASPSSVTVTLDAAPDVVKGVRISTDAGTVTRSVRGRDPTTIALPAGTTTRVRLSAAARSFDLLAVSDLSIPGVSVSRPLRLPAVPARWGAPEQIVLSADDAYRSGCAELAGVARCVPSNAQWGEDGRVLDRELALTAPARYPVRVGAEAIGGRGLDDLLQRGRGAAAQASSYEVEAPQRSAVLAVDGDPLTAWVADADDPDPTLTLRWIGTRSIDRVRIRTNTSVAASKLGAATLSFSGGQQRRVTLVDGRARFPAVRAAYVEVHLRKAAVRRSSDPNGAVTELPVGVGEVRLQGRSLFPRPPVATTTTGACGSGPSVAVDGVVHPTRLTYSPAGLLAGVSPTVSVCGLGSLDLSAGTHRLTVAGTDSVRPTYVVLGATPTSSTATAARVGRWGSARRSVTVAGAGQPQLLSVAENTNAGWVATAGGAALERVRVDGWQQGWVLPPQTERVSLRFGADTTYRWALVVGLVALLALVAFLLVRRRQEVPVSVGGRTPRSLVGLVLLVGAAGLVGGSLGAALAILAFAVGRVAERSLGLPAAWLAGAAVAVAGTGYALRPWAGESTWAGDLAWPQWAVLIALGLASSSAFGSGRLVRRRRIAGSSTTR